MKFNRIFFAITGLALLAVTASAQTYYTNVLNGATNGNFAGAQTPYQTLPQRYLPGQVMSAQTNTGICYGTSTTTANATVTNSFGGMTYTAAPVVTVTQTGTPIVYTAVTNVVVTVTTSNFVYNGGGPAVTFNWMAVGH